MVRVPGCFNQESYLSDCSTDFESSSREGKIYEGSLIGRQDLTCEFGQSTYASLEEAPVNTGYQDPVIKDCLAFHSKREDPHQKLVQVTIFSHPMILREYSLLAAMLRFSAGDS